jgi:ParB family chromosome partitioning protein
MARKHSLDQLTSVNNGEKSDGKEKLTPVNKLEQPDEIKSVAHSSQSPSAVGAVSRSFEKLRLQGISEIDPELIDPPIVSDRLEIQGPKLEHLIEQIKTSEQQVPILIRPSPSDKKRYQIVYGWRRTAAARKLGIKVKASIKDLTDKQVVIAQGQENNEREDLSFIEKALYAVNLEEKGFDRNTIMASVSIDKTVCSRLISIVGRISIEFITAIGPAPKVGRTRWSDLAKILENKEQFNRVKQLISKDEFLDLSSDERFEYVLDALTRKPKKKSQTVNSNWVADDGSKVAKITKSDTATKVTIDNNVAPDFGEYILQNLPDLYLKFKSNNQG